jgi:hypothetical protein
MKIASLALATASALVLLAPAAHAQDLQPPPPMNSGQEQQPQQQPQQPQQPQQQQLAPPPPLQQQSAPPPVTEQRLDESKKEDSGRGLEFLYINAQIGAVFDALGTFNNTLQIQNTNAGGAMLGAEAGVRFVWFTLGVRFRYDVLQPFNIWQLNAVLGFHIPAGSWDPYVSFHGGYSAIGSIDPSNFNASQVLPGTTSQDAANAFSTRGGNVGFSVGVDYYVARFFSIGIDGSFEFLFLHRDPLTPPTVDGVACSQVPSCASALMGNSLYQQSGDAAGISLVASAHLALHL